jgi:TRAP-type mannitol/chloroaromatic compound transport system permease large subunit
MLVVMGPVMGVPVNMLYSAAFGPGFFQAAPELAEVLRADDDRRRPSRRGAPRTPRRPW